MIRTQVRLPDELYQRAKIFAAEREVSLAEITRRGLELFLDRFPESPAPKRA
jgi:predicted DNA-binding protein